MSRISDAISNYFGRNKQYHVLQREQDLHTFELVQSRMLYGRTIYLNICQLLTDIYAEVEWLPMVGYDGEVFKGWKRFLQYNGQRLLLRLLTGKGYCVIAWRKVDDTWVFWELKESEYTTRLQGGLLVVIPNDPTLNYYVLKSPTFDNTGMSDYELCKPYIKLLDVVLNGTYTISERLGTFIIGSPATPSGAPTIAVLNEKQKDELEKQLQREYGALSHQKQIMVLPNGMNFQTVSLAGLDLRMNDKARLAILAICDRLKVPANQVAIIDANSSKSLSNGSELREGDLSKYRSFRRLLDSTLYDFAVEIGLQVTYTIENEPLTAQGQTIEQQ